MTRIQTYTPVIAILALLVGPLPAGAPTKANSLAEAGSDPVVSAPVVTVRLYTLDSQAAPHMPRAIAEAARVFDRAGLRVRWFDCTAGETQDPACATAPSPKDIRLRILPGKGGRQFDDALGYALATTQGGGVYANVLFGAVTEVRRGTTVSTAQVLGHVIAHEMGHLLLGTVRHSRTGVMTAKWEHEELMRIGRREMRFDDQQTRRIRETARARMLADAAASPVAIAGLRMPGDEAAAE
jgi:hypothetical protein